MKNVPSPSALHELFKCETMAVLHRVLLSSKIFVLLYSCSAVLLAVRPSDGFLTTSSCRTPCSSTGELSSVLTTTVVYSYYNGTSCTAPPTLPGQGHSLPSREREKKAYVTSRAGVLKTIWLQSTQFCCQWSQGVKVLTPHTLAQEHDK